MLTSRYNQSLVTAGLLLLLLVGMGVESGEEETHASATGIGYLCQIFLSSLKRPGLRIPEPAVSKAVALETCEEYRKTR